VEGKRLGSTTAGHASREASLDGPHSGRPMAERTLCSSGKESATRIGEGLKGPKEKPLLKLNHGSGNLRCSLKELWGRDITETQFTLVFLVPQHD